MLLLSDFRVFPKLVTKMKNKIRELTDRNNGMSNVKREEKYQQFVEGWVNYFKLADMKNLIKETDEWARGRSTRLNKRNCTL